MKVIVTGARLFDWSMKGEDNVQRTGKSGTLSYVKAKVATDEGASGRLAGTSKCDAGVAEYVQREFKRTGAPFLVFDVETDVKGKGENMKVLITDAEFLGVYGKDYGINKDGVLASAAGRPPAVAAA